MELGLVGLGKMGNFMRDRIRMAGHTVIGYDPKSEVSDVSSLSALAEKLSPARIIWLMIPAGDITRNTIHDLAGILEPGDLVIDGGNSRYTDDIINAQILVEKNINYIDCGVSGGIWGKEYGYGLMVGGEDKDIARAMFIFDALRPAGPREEGFVHVGSVGAGHFAKMVHNGVEYGLMQSYAEGYELLASDKLVKNPTATLKAWKRGTVVRSWLLDLLVRALEEDPDLKNITGYTEDSGEGRWTVEVAINHAVPVPVISSALFSRFSSRQKESPTMKAVAALRNQFGGHAVQPVKL